MRALITGATGCIGRCLVRRLIQQGHDVAALVRQRQRSQPDPVQELRGYGATIVEGTVFDAPVLAAAMEKTDVVFHVAWHWHRPDAPGAPQAATFEEQWHENVEGTHLLIEAAKQARVRRLVFTSTVWVYPEQLPSPIREDGPTFTPQSLRGHPVENYVAPKLAVEEMIRHLLPSQDYVILRPSLMYGIGARWVPELIRAMLQGPPRRMVRPEQWIHVEDVASAAILAAEVSPAAGMTFNIAGGETIGSDQMRDVVQRMAARLTAPAASPDKTVLHLTTPRFDIGLARQHLGFEPQISLIKGLEEMVAAEVRTANASPLRARPQGAWPSW